MDLDLRDYLGVLRKRRLVVAVVMAACIGVAAAVTAMATPTYEATAQLFVGQRQIAATEVTQGFALTQLSLQLLKSYAAILRTRPIAESAVESEDLPLNPRDLSQQIHADPVLDTQLIALSYQSTDPLLAQRTVNAVADAFVKEVERIETRKTADAEPAVKVSVVERALRPESPVSPRPVRNLALATVLGLMLGTASAFALDYFDTTVKTANEAEHLSGSSVLATIPKVDVRQREVFLERDSRSPAAEAFRKLRTAVQFLGVDSPLNVVLVTSAEAAEGKTTTALNLAAAFAQAGVRVILVEADLRRPVLHTLFAVEGQRGLTSALIGRSSLEQVVSPTPTRNLSFVAAGTVPPNPAELLSSNRMADVIAGLRTMSDMVVVDSPPLLPVADASALASRMDGVLLVTRLGQTHRDRLVQAAQLIGTSGGRLLGVVLNFQTGRDGGYGGYYYASAPTFQTERGQSARRDRPERAAVDQDGVA